MLQFALFLCTYRLTVVTTYVHNNFYLVSTYMLCMIDFGCSNLYIICAATHVYNILFFLQLSFKYMTSLCLWQFVYKLMHITYSIFWQLLFKYMTALCLWQFVYKLMCKTYSVFGSFSLNMWQLYVYDNLYIN